MSSNYVLSVAASYVAPSGIFHGFNVYNGNILSATAFKLVIAIAVFPVVAIAEPSNVLVNLTNA